MVEITLALLPEGTEWKDFMTPSSADSLVGRGDVVRILQYGVREGSEAREAGVLGCCSYCNLQSIVHLASQEVCYG